MNKLFLSLPLILLALVLPAGASAGDGQSPERPAENQSYCGPDKVCEPPTELCKIGVLEYHPHPAQENCIWPDDPCVTEPESCFWPDDPCVTEPESCFWPDPCVTEPESCFWPDDPCVTNWTEDGPVPDKCFWPADPCDTPVSSGDSSAMGFPTPDEGEAPERGKCDFPVYHCYAEGVPGESGGSEPGYEGSDAGPGWEGGIDPIEDISYPPGYEVDDPGHGVEDPGGLVCIYDLAPTTQEKGKGKNRAAARKRAQARRKAAVKRTQARRKATRKRVAAKRERLKAKKAAQGRNR